MMLCKDTRALLLRQNENMVYKTASSPIKVPSALPSLRRHETHFMGIFVHWFLSLL